MTSPQATSRTYIGGHMFKRVSCFLMSVCLFTVAALAQRTTGDIQGAVADKSGAVIPNAQVSVFDEGTDKVRRTSLDSDGGFRIIELLPGTYTILVEAQGFASARLEHVPVRIGAVTPLDVRLEIGQVTEQVTVVGAEATRVDTATTEVGGIVGAKEIEQLAIIGRNVMDLAQLEPGVQLRDGGEIDGTKNNFTVAALEGRSGRETQIQWDGLSIQDYSVGASVANIGLDAIQEFQVAQGSMNPAQSLASGGAVNIVSRTGSNSFHGSGYAFFRDKRLSAKVGPTAVPYDRNMVGGRFGGPLLKNRVFFFVNGERNNTRDSFFGDPPGFANLQAFYSKPFKDNFVVGRLDVNISSRVSAFGRFSHSNNVGVVGSPTLGGSRLDGFDNKTQANIFAGGLTFTTTKWIHQWRFEHLAFFEKTAPATGLPTFRDSLGRPFLLSIDGGGTLSEGPAFLTNQIEGQRTQQFKYDAGYVRNKHTLRFGFDLVHWVTLGNFPLLINGPQLNTSSALSTSTNPLDYPLVFALLGNAQGYLSEKPVLGFPHGGTFQWRPAAYFHDTWLAPHHLTINYGLRYLWMSDIVNPDLERSPLLDEFLPNLSRRTTTPKTNFSPEAGIAWDPSGSGKTVIRAGASIQYEELTNDASSLDRTSFFPPGIGLGFAGLASGVPLIDPRSGNPFGPGDPLATSFGFPNGTSGSVLAPLFGQPIGTSAAAIYNLSQLFQAATAEANKNFPAGPTTFELLREISFDKDFTLSFFPDIKTPHVIQFNVGIQRELRHNLVFSADYVKIRGLSFPLDVDLNHIGEARTSSLSRTNAIAAIGATNASFGCPADASGAAIDCAIAAGATISSYGSNGLGAGPGFQGFAFRGMNPNFGVMQFILPGSTSDYNALDLRLQGRFGPVNTKSFSWVRGSTLSVTHSLSRKTGVVKPGGTQGLGAADQSSFPAPWDNANPQHFKGPFSLDRTSMLSFASITDLRGGFRFSQITHWFTALPQSPIMPVALGGCDGGPSEIFCSDVTGDGLSADLLPTAFRPGSFGRDLKGASGLNRAISAYNSQFAGNPTAAGKVLISEGLFTRDQLKALGAVMPQLPLAPTGQVGLDPLFTVDLRISWHHKFEKGPEIEPVLDIFNAFNRTHYDPPGNLLTGDLTGTAGHINGTTPSERTNIRQRGSGTFEAGARRQLQVGLRITF